MIRSVLTLVVAVALSACVTTPKHPVTEIQVAVAYGLGNSAKNTPRVNLGPNTVPATDALGSPWWQQFADERLNRLVAKVLAVNTDLASAGLRLEQARLTAGLAADAMWPHLDATLSSDYDKPLQSGTSSSHRNSASVGVSYMLDLWGKLRSQREVATWEAQATAEDLQSTVLLLVGDTCNLYWTLAFLNQRITAGEQSLDRLQRTLQLVQGQFNAGAVSRLEVREAEQNVETQRAAQSQLVQQRIETRNALTVLLDGYPWPETDELQSLDETHSPDIQSGLPAELLARRPDLRAAELRLRAALANVDVAATSYYPAISLTGAVGGTSTALGDVLANPIATLGAGVTLPFLHWNEMKLNTRIAGADYEIAATDFRKTLYTAFTDVDNALSARVELSKQLDARQKSFDAAVDVERLYEVRYRSGATPLRLWLDAQETRRSAELSLAEARLSQLQNDAILFQALGGSA